jgi:MASE9
MGEKTTRGQTVHDLPVVARVFVSAVIGVGVTLMGAALWRASYGQPILLSLLILLSVVVHTMKLELPLGRSSSTLSLGYAVNFVSLLLLGSGAAVLVTVLGGWAQCSFYVKKRNPRYRTLFSVSCLALSMAGGAYVLTGSVAFSAAAPALYGIRAVVTSALVYFLCNSILIATAVSLTTRQSLVRVWDQEYLWGAPNYFVGALVALLAARAVHLWG